MAERFPGGIINKTPPTVSGPGPGTSGTASGVWTLDEVLGYVKAGTWPGAPLPVIQLYGWGDNDLGQLGLNDIVNRSSPTQVSSEHWLYADVGLSHLLAIKGDGTLWSSGNDGSGQLGLGVYPRVNKSSPVQVGALTDWAQVSTGERFSAAVKTDNTLWTWGSNSRGELGQGDRSERSSPTKVGSLSNWAQVSANNGVACTVAVKTDGTLWGWGYRGGNRYGAAAYSSPVQIGSATNWAQVSVGFVSAHAITTSGTLWGWSRNNYDGDVGTNNRNNYNVPVQIGALTNWRQVSNNDNFTTATKTDNTLWTWGNNAAGKLGQNISDSIKRSSPVQVGALTDWLYAYGGRTHALALKTNNTLWGWGSGLRAGLNTATNYSSPVQVGSDTDWQKIGTGQNATLALKG